MIWMWRSQMEGEEQFSKILQPYSASVHEERNGDWSLTMDLPAEETECTVGTRVYCSTPYDDPKKGTKYRQEAFRVAETEVSYYGSRRVTARHIFYDMADNYIPMTRVVDDKAQDALQALLNGCVYPPGFVGETDLETVGTAYWEMLNPVEALIGTQDNSFVNRFGGVLYRTGNHFKITKQRPPNVRVQYGYNLEKCGLKLDYSHIVTRIYPTGTVEGGGILHGEAVDSKHIGEYPFPKIRRIHYSDISVPKLEPNAETGTVPPEVQAAYDKGLADLQAAAEAEFQKGVDLPQLSGTLSVYDLSQFREYKNANTFTRIMPFAEFILGLPDGKQITAQMVAYDFDPISLRYTNISVGMADMYAGESLQKSINALGARVAALENQQTGGSI